MQRNTCLTVKPEAITEAFEKAFQNCRLVKFIFNKRNGIQVIFSSVRSLRKINGGDVQRGAEILGKRKAAPWLGRGCILPAWVP